MNISAKEWKLMQLLWERQPQTITQLTKVLQEQEGWSKNIVITYLKRLQEKGAVYYEEGARAKQFYPRITQREAQQREIRSFLGKVFDGDAGLLVNTMVKEELLSSEELKRLEQLLHGGEEN